MKNGSTRGILSLARLLLLIALAAPLTLGSLASQPSLAAAPSAITGQAAANERITNGSFDSGSADPWWGGANTALHVTSGKLCVDVTGGTANPWDAIIGQNAVTLEEGASYSYSFEASATQATTIRTTVQINAPPYTAALNEAIALTTTPQTFTFSFTSGVATEAGQVTFQLGGGASNMTVCLDNISLAGGAADNERITNGSFSDGSFDPWWGGANTALHVTSGKLCVDVTGGTANPWDAIIGQNGIVLENGVSYTYTFEASATQATTIRTTVQINAPPYTAALNEAIALTTTPQTFTFSFTSGVATEAGQVTFQLGGGASNITVCLDNISLAGGAAPPVYEPDTGPRVRVNQVGYTPGLPKRATLVTESAAPLAWQLKNSAGTVVKSGVSTVFGLDAASRDTVQLIDFSDYNVAGGGYTLTADGETSYPFAIGASLYNQLRYDALAYFYHNRSGIPIEAKYVGAQYARPAGHVGVAPNQGDTNVTCAPDVPCSYALNVAGGWYDAGDHGKYVVNGGISVWTLQNQFERLQRVAAASAADFGDGKLRIPENANGRPDLLDEARWEMEFLLRMQVPDGQPLAGMVHHKIHDANWTGLPLRPDQDPQQRFLRPPSTAATLNVAATAAQCARLWQPYDPAFAARCLTAAEKAWSAAKAHPAIYAPGSDGNGGGAYSDNNVSDEFYWAAAELFVTTGKSEYRSFVTSSPHFKLATLSMDGFSWGFVAPLGDLSLALAPQRLSGSEIGGIRSAIASFADKQIDAIRTQGYPVAYKTGGYVWGSNSQVLNNLLLVAAAYDYTGSRKYLDAVFEGMDYLLGRNALNNSYITGYGSVFSQNQHHRFWANQLDSSLPHPAPGSIAGGPNSGIEDPIASKLLPGCAPQKCYIDNIESWSTNEITINWNAPLAWVAGFLSEKAALAPALDQACASPTVISGNGQYAVAAGGTCFKYVNAAFQRGALFTVRNTNSTATNTVVWYGVRDQNQNNCAVHSAALPGNGAQITNIGVKRDASNAMVVFVKGSVNTQVVIEIRSWQNGPGC